MNEPLQPVPKLLHSPLDRVEIEKLSGRMESVVQVYRMNRVQIMKSNRFHIVLCFVVFFGLGIQDASAYYAPEMGRFISRDPIGYDAGDVNVYRASLNNFTVYVDPRGLTAKPTINGIDMGTVPIYPSPTGEFDIDIVTANIDPTQQLGMGSANATAYKISYNSPKGTCDGTNESITLTQSVVFTTFLAPSPHFDSKNHKDNKGKPYPVYKGQGDGRTHIIDSPRYTWGINKDANTKVRLTVCAICTTTLDKICPDENLSIAIAQNLGCISFTWQDVDKTLQHGGETYGSGSSGRQKIPATTTDKDWGKAKKDWDNFK